LDKYKTTVMLKDGSTLRLRPIQQEDEERLEPISRGSVRFALVGDLLARIKDVNSQFVELLLVIQ
jgi:hypothetical protein